MKKLILAMLLLALSGTVAGADDEWTQSQKAAATAFVVASAFDAASTINGLNNGKRELNPLYGSHPSDKRVILTKLAIVGGVLWYADRHPSDREGLWWAAGLTGVVVVYNLR